jgi:hypothetical protein
VSYQQNAMNGKKHKNSTSQYKGVSFFKRDQNWHAQIMLNSKQIHIGYFEDEIDAARAYDTKAKELFGTFAKTNF